jgi:hypothetical protein
VINLREKLSETFGPELMFLDDQDFDTAILGVAKKTDGNDVVVYDTVRVIQVLERDMSYEEAVEYFDFNISCAYLGPRTPIYLSSYTI